MHHEESNKPNLMPVEATNQSIDSEAFVDEPRAIPHADDNAAFSNSTLTSTHGKRRRNRNILAIALCAALGLFIYFYFFKSKPADAPKEEANIVVSVRTAKVERQPIAIEVRALGTIFPRGQATVSATVGGQIRQMRVLKNQVVKQGEVIAQLDARDVQAQRAEAETALQNARLQARGVTAGAIPQAIAQNERDLQDARANVANARAVYERRQALYKQGGIALKDVEASQLALTTAEDNLRLVQRTTALRTTAINPNDRALAQSAVTQAEGRIATLNAQLSFASIRAPLTGIVTDQFQFEGEYAASGARLATIADTSEVIVKAQFADTVVANLKTGDAAIVLPNDVPGERMGGRVSLISRSSDPANRTVEVWVNLGNAAGRLRAGSAADVIVSTNSINDALVVPASAVTLDASNAKTGTVMVVDDTEIAHETKVEIGIRTPKLIQITSGVDEGERVVTEGNYALPDGTKVQENANDEEDGNSKGDAAGGEK